MDPMWKDIKKLPNMVSLARIFMAPVLFGLAFAGRPWWFIGVFLFAEFTDVLDGFLARLLDQKTRLGSHLDSWSDFIIYTTVAICAWILWPQVVRREAIWIAIIVLCFIVPAAAGYMKFRTFTGYHTRGVKVAAVMTVIGYILLFTGLLDWPLRIASLFCLYAAIEEIAITLLMSREQVDVSSLRQALKARNEKRNQAP